MVINQRILRVGAILAVAGTTGLVMQVRAPEALTVAEPEAGRLAGLATTIAGAAPQAAPEDQTAAPLLSDAAPELAQDSPSEPAPPMQLAALSTEPSAPVLSLAQASVSDGTMPSKPAEPLSSTPPAGLAPAEATPPQSSVQGCAADMALIVQPGAMLDIGLISSCRPNQRVVIRHAGLTVTGLTSAAGTLIASIPALASPAEVSLTFFDGTSATESAEVPDLGRYARFAIQWHEDDAFQLRAYPKGFEAGEAEVISAASPGTVSAEGGYLLTLGDAAAPRPLLAEVFTWPAGHDLETSPVKLMIEAEVTATSCAREILGETLQLSGGALSRYDFSIEMPECSAAGEYVALPNPVMTGKLASH